MKSGIFNITIYLQCLKLFADREDVNTLDTAAWPLGLCSGPEILTIRVTGHQLVHLRTTSLQLGKVSIMVKEVTGNLLSKAERRL